MDRGARRLGSQLEVRSRRKRDGMRSALGPCSNDDRVLLCLAAAVNMRRQTGIQAACRRQHKDTAGTHVLPVPAASCSAPAPAPAHLAPCSSCCYRAPPLSSPIVHRLGYLQYGYGYAVSLSPSTHLLACFACIRLPHTHPPSRHGASFSFPVVCSTETYTSPTSSLVDSLFASDLSHCSLCLQLESP